MKLYSIPKCVSLQCNLQCILSIYLYIYIRYLLLLWYNGRSGKRDFLKGLLMSGVRSHFIQIFYFACDKYICQVMFAMDRKLFNKKIAENEIGFSIRRFLEHRKTRGWVSGVHEEPRKRGVVADILRLGLSLASSKETALLCSTSLQYQEHKTTKMIF